MAMLWRGFWLFAEMGLGGVWLGCWLLGKLMRGEVCLRRAGACLVLLLEFLLVFVFLTSWQESLPDSQKEIPPALLIRIP
jgi:hypothetical protein